MLKYASMDMNKTSNPLETDSVEVQGFSFLQRLVHDEECYQQLKAFLVKDTHKQSKELADFCDAVKKFERTNIPSDRLGQASIVFWEYFASDGAKSLPFPPGIALDIQSLIQDAHRAYRTGKEDEQSLPGSLFQPAMSHLETSVFEKTGVFERFVEYLEKNASSSSSGSSSGGQPVPAQLSLFDAFSVTELNARIYARATSLRNCDPKLSIVTKPIVNRRQSVPTSVQPFKARVDPLDVCRLFLSQIGMVPTQQAPHETVHIKLLENGGKLDRSLKHLDKAPTRETMKIGVIYVGPRQKTQQEILRNSRGSPAYTRFIQQLGWQVDLERHHGFAGGLDCNPKSLSNGKRTLYFANAHTEVIFHVVTMMPTMMEDHQQIDKKRHVGNDYVHIVWSENDTHDYDPSTITSHFNDVQIVIYPLRKIMQGLYLVKIHSKDRVPPFGPLLSGMVVYEADLPELVRQTAMNANRVCRSQTSIYVRPYPTRKKLVDEIVDRYATEFKESQLLDLMFTHSHASAGPPLVGKSVVD